MMNGIFYIGNNSSWRATIANLLRDEGVPSINIFLNSCSAIERLYLDPDVVIVSDDVEDMKARDVMRLIHNYNRDTTVIVLTESNDLQHTANLLSDGAWDVLRMRDGLHLQLLSSLLQSEKNKQVRESTEITTPPFFKKSSNDSGACTHTGKLPYPPIPGRI